MRKKTLNTEGTEVHQGKAPEGRRITKLPMVEYDPYVLSPVREFAVVAGAEGACQFRSDEVGCIYAEAGQSGDLPGLHVYVCGARL